MWISSHWCQWNNYVSRFSKHLRWKYYLLMAYSTSYRTIYWSGIFKLFFRLQVIYLFSSLIYYCLHLLICLYFSHDFLTIYDGSSNTSLTFGQYCGNSIPQSRISSTNEMYIYFQSNGKDHNITEMAGFQINYRTYSKYTYDKICIYVFQFSLIYDLFNRQNCVIELLFSWTNGRWKSYFSHVTEQRKTSINW